MTRIQTASFVDEALHSVLEQASDADLDVLDFGVIGFDSDGIVRRYNRFESVAAGLSPQPTRTLFPLCTPRP